MIERVNVLSSTDPLFAECWRIYCESFPTCERRPLEYQLETMLRREYHLDAIVEDDQLIGILGWWDLPDARYIEHLATSPNIRNGGYGAKILAQFCDECPTTKKTILEVEHPEDELSIRRIGFYERMGFHLSDLPYSHPPYDRERVEFVSLRIMTYPTTINKEWLENFTNEYFSMIHFDHFRA